MTQQKEGASVGGSANVDYALMTLEAYKGLVKAAGIYDGLEGETNSFTQALYIIQRDAESSGGVEEAIRQQHKTFLFF